MDVWKRQVIRAAAGMIFGTVILTFYFGRWSPAAREAREFLTALPPERITAIRLQPYAVSSLVSREVVISDRADVERVADQLRTARGTSLNHPSARWIAILRITTAAGDYGGQVESTTNQGVLVLYASGVQSGWNYGAVRQDSLGPILEDIVARAGGR